MDESMKKGVQNWVNSALDTKDDICLKMMEAGVDPKQALLASTVVTKDEVANQLNQRLEGKSASEITKGLKSDSTSNPLSRH
ncbi:hypothetical protein [Vibrio vulnificus]|uniref:hypothetical protein n=1 Tax=Vibrio vulnificus TaxID=672 RepID=UPI001CDC06FF|nr:hypothetical protein [Vibrio vulnificus]MCA3916735.1 hypothetical protein [Vibrio vulnificus]